MGGGGSTIAFGSASRDRSAGKCDEYVVKGRFQ